MAIALVNSGQVSTASGTTLAFTPGWTPAVGNYLIAIGLTHGAGQPQGPSCSDTVNGTYTRLFQQFDGSAILDQSILYVKVATATTPVVTYATGGASAEKITLVVLEVSGLDASSIFTGGQNVNATGTNTGPSPGSLTNSTASALFLAFASNTDTSTTATWTEPGGSWTVVQENKNGSTGVVGSVLAQIVSTSASQTTSWVSSSFLWVASLVALNGATTTTTIAVNDANLFWSPYNWRPNGATWKQANTSGAYLLATLNPTTQIKVNVDVSPLTGGSASAADYPQLAWSIDGGAWSMTQLTSASTQVSLATGLANGSHTARLVFYAPGTGSPATDRWTTPVLVCRITGIVVDSGGATVALTPRSKRMLFYGDSITEGFNIAPLTTNAFDARYSYAFHVADAFGAEVGLCAFGGQRLCTTTSVTGINVVGLFPTAGTGTWDHYDSATSRLSAGLLSPAPDYIVINMGTNDFSGGTTNATMTAQMQGLLNALRTAAPSAQIFVVIPFNEHYQSAIGAGSLTLDGSMHVIDCGAEFAAGFTGSSTYRSADAVHPNAFGAMEAAARVTQLAQSALDGSGGFSWHAAGGSGFGPS